MSLRLKVPFREEMFVNPRTMHKLWVKFFTGVEAVSEEVTYLEESSFSTDIPNQIVNIDSALDTVQTLENSQIPDYALEERVSNIESSQYTEQLYIDSGDNDLEFYIHAVS